MATNPAGSIYSSRDPRSFSRLASVWSVIACGLSEVGCTCHFFEPGSFLESNFGLPSFYALDPCFVDLGLVHEASVSAVGVEDHSKEAGVTNHPALADAELGDYDHGGITYANRMMQVIEGKREP